MGHACWDGTRRAHAFCDPKNLSAYGDLQSVGTVSVAVQWSDIAKWAFEPAARQFATAAQTTLTRRDQAATAPHIPQDRREGICTNM